MQTTNGAPTRKAIVALMGPTGTGKSTFINLLTKDDNIRIGHDLDSQTVDITTSRYMQDGISVTLVDTPGFDDSREGITDTDILGKIADFLQEKGGRKLNGIIYLHRISDPRMGGAAKKNLRVFREICGDKRLDHVRIVTTNWNLVDEKQGNSRQDALAKGAFGLLIKEGAYLYPHDNGLESAQSIMSQLIHQEPVTMMIQEELSAGRTLGDTSAGALIVEEMKELKKKHDKEVEGLKKELEDASKANDEELRLELAEERRKLEEMMARAEEDRKTLKKTRVPRETLPKSDAVKRVQPVEMRATTIVASDVPRFLPPPQRYNRLQRQGDDTGDRGSQLPQVLHDTRRVTVQPAKNPKMRATVVLPPPQRHYRAQNGQGNDISRRRCWICVCD